MLQGNGGISPAGDSGGPLQDDSVVEASADANNVHRDAVRRQAGTPVSWAITGLCMFTFLWLNLLHPAQVVNYTFSPGNGLLWPGILSHMFLHNDAMHLFFNLFLLFAIGRLVEEGYGPWRFSFVFLTAGLIAALAQAAFMPQVFLLGASGALAGILAVFVRHLPHAELLVFGIIPMPAWVLAILWMGYNLYGAAAGQGNIAFVAHIAGFLAGLLTSWLLVPPGRRVRRRGR